MQMFKTNQSFIQKWNVFSQDDEYASKMFDISLEQEQRLKFKRIKLNFKSDPFLRSKFLLLENCFNSKQLYRNINKCLDILENTNQFNTIGVQILQNKQNNDLEVNFITDQHKRQISLLRFNFRGSNGNDYLNLSYSPKITLFNNFNKHEGIGLKLEKNLMSLTRNQIKGFIRFPFLQLKYKESGQLYENMFQNVKVSVSSKHKDINEDLGERSQYMKCQMRNQMRDWCLRLKSKSSQNVFNLSGLDSDDVFQHRMNYNTISLKAKKNIIQNVTLFENGNQSGTQMDASIEFKYNHHYQNVIKTHFSHQWNWFTQDIKSIQNINLQNDLRFDYVQGINNYGKSQFSMNDLLIKNRKTRGFMNDIDNYQLKSNQLILVNNMTRLHINDFPVLKSLSNDYYRQLNPMVYVNSQLSKNGEWQKRASLGIGMNMKYEEIGLEISYILGQWGGKQRSNGLSINMIG